MTVRRGESRPSPTTATRALAYRLSRPRRGHASTADFSEDAVNAAVGKGARHRPFTAEDPDAGLADPSGSRAFSRISTFTTLGACGGGCCNARMRSRGRRAGGGSPHHQHGRGNGRVERIGIRLRELERLCRRIPQHAPPHRLRGDRRPGRRRRHATRLLVHRRTRGIRPPAGLRSRPHRRRAHSAPAGRTELGTLDCPVLFEAPGAADLIGSFVGAVSLRPTAVSFLLDSLARSVFLDGRFARIRTSRAPAAVRLSTTKAWRRRRAMSCETVSCAAISSAATRRASSAWSRPAMRVAATISW